MSKEITDIFIVGGGINGVGIAADAAGRGLKVTLCEKDDLASATSSYSSKMIHGGLRYLENYEFRLVREALREREILLHAAPHLIHPLQIIMPHDAHLRPYWMIRLGLFLYDHLGGKQTLPKCQSLRFSQLTEQPLATKYKRGFMYSDGRVDDSRLVLANALAAKAQGATILTRHELISAKREKNCWELELHDHINDSYQTIYAKAVINAAGPWVDKILSQVMNIPSQQHIRLVKGSHIVVPKLYPGKHGYLLQNSDKRVIFVLPFQEEFHLIGTTDVDYQGEPDKAKISPEEQSYLCNAVNQYFKAPIKAEQIVWHFAGVRPLLQDEHADASKVTRDYSFSLNEVNEYAPVLSIFGGKITTYRKLAEHALEKLAAYFPQMGPAWTAHAKLPGGNFIDYRTFLDELSKRYAWLPNNMLQRFASAYGDISYTILGQANSMHDLGEYFGGSLYEAEVSYLITHEWALTIEDILWRRTKQGLFLNEAQIRHLSEWLHKHHLP